MTHLQEPNLISTKEVEKPKRKISWKKWVILTLIVLVLAGFGIYKYLLSGYPEAFGLVRSGNELFIDVKKEGILKEVHVENSQRVKKNDVLFEFDNHETEKESLEITYKREALKESRDLVQKELEQAKQSFERANILFENGVIGKGEYEGAKLNVERIDAKYAETTHELEVIERKEEMFNKDKNTLVIKAPFDGIFLGDIKPKRGNYFKKGDLLGLVFDPEDFYFEALFDERSATKVSIGDKAQINFNSFPGIYDGEVAEIDEKAENIIEKVYKERNVIRMKIRLNHFPSGLRPYMKGKVRIMNGVFNGNDQDGSLAEHFENSTRQKMRLWLE